MRATKQKKKIGLLSNSTGNFDMLGLHAMQLRAIINVIQLESQIESVSSPNAKADSLIKKLFKRPSSPKKLIARIKEKFNHLKSNYPIETQQKILSHLDSLSVGIPLLKKLETQDKDITKPDISNQLETLNAFDFYKMLIAIHNHCKITLHKNEEASAISEPFLHYALSTLPPVLNFCNSGNALDQEMLNKSLKKMYENANKLCSNYQTRFNQPSESFTYIVDAIANVINLLEQDKIKSQAQTDGKSSSIKILLKKEEIPLKVIPNEKLEKLFTLFYNVVTSINTLVTNQTEEQLFQNFTRFIEQIEKDSRKSIQLLNFIEIKKFIKDKIFNDPKFITALLGYVTPLESILKPYLLKNANSQAMAEECHSLLSTIKAFKSLLEEIEVYSTFYKKGLDIADNQPDIEVTVEIRAKSRLTLITDENKRATFLVNRNSIFHHNDNSDHTAETEDKTYRYSCTTL